jgi:hypothetical protein
VTLARSIVCRCHSLPCAPVCRLPSATPLANPESPAAPTPTRSMTLTCSPVCRRRPKLQHSPPGSRLQSSGRSPSPMTPVLIPCPLREQDIHSAPGPSRTRCSSTAWLTPPRCHPERQARASPCAVSALLHGQRRSTSKCHQAPPASFIDDTGDVLSLSLCCYE